ncbi:MAG: hypothetical protein AAFU49_23360 [Pseudomonadota bacterium]
MIVLFWVGALIATAAVGALGWCIFSAMRLKVSELDEEAVRTRLRSLGIVNAGAVAGAFLGLALMLAGGLLGN